MSEAPETLRNLGYHLRVMADKASEQIDADRLSRAADEVERADLPPTLSAAMELPEVQALVEAFKDQNELMRSALEIAKREGINGEIGTTNWDAYYNKVAVSLKRSASALAAIKEPKT